MASAPEESMYPDTGDTTQDGAEDSADPKDKSEGETALIPKSILAGKEFNPGDEVTFKIVHMYEDEVEVEFVSEKKGSSEMDGADAKVDAMAAQGPAGPGIGGIGG